MRTVTLAFLCGIALVGCSASKSSSDEGAATTQDLIGRPAPDIRLTDMSGKKFSLAESRGKPVFIDFWATWCPPCRISMPEVKKLHEEFANRGVELVGISLDDRVDKVTTYAAQNDIKHRLFIALNSGVDQEYRIRGIPTFVAVDKQGKVSKIWSGFSPEMPAEWRAELERLLKA